jgi:hypothetical protein
MSNAIRFLEFSYSHLKCDVHFKITNKSKVNKSHIKFNDNFKNHITFMKTLEKFYEAL